MGESTIEWLLASSCHLPGACADRVWDLMGKMDGLGDFEGIVARVQNNSEYAAGVRKVSRTPAGRGGLCGISSAC